VDYARLAQGYLDRRVKPASSKPPAGFVASFTVGPKFTSHRIRRSEINSGIRFPKGQG
jgi:hypothetical protein